MRTAIHRALLVLTPAASVVAIAVGFAGGIPAEGLAAVVPALSTPASSAPSVAAAVPACTTDDLTATVVGQQRGAVRTASLRLTNTTGHPCRIGGRAEVALVTPPGELVRVATRHVDRPAAPVAFDLAPQRSAWADLRWHTCRPAQDGCGVGVALQFAVDAESDGAVADFVDVPEADGDGVTMSSLEIGSLQPSGPAAGL